MNYLSSSCVHNHQAHAASSTWLPLFELYDAKGYCTATVLLQYCAAGTWRTQVSN
jgi:hypothetical protein